MRPQRNVPDLRRGGSSPSRCQYTVKTSTCPIQPVGKMSQENEYRTQDPEPLVWIRLCFLPGEVTEPLSLSLFHGEAGTLPRSRQGWWKEHTDRARQGAQLSRCLVRTESSPLFPRKPELRAMNLSFQEQGWQSRLDKHPGCRIW